MADSPQKTSVVRPSAGRLDASLTGSDVAAASTDMAQAGAMAPDACMDSPDDLLVDRHYAVVYRYVYRLSGCAWSAEDIAQETFVQAILHRDQLRVAEAERGWVLSIARRVYLRWLRGKSRATYGRTLTDADGDQADVWQELAERQATRVEERAEHEDWLQAALAKLGEDARLALVMYHFEELSYAEIAEQLQIPIGTVMSRLSRARGQLRTALEQSEQPNSQLTNGQRETSRADAPSLTWPATIHTKPIGQEARHG